MWTAVLDTNCVTADSWLNSAAWTVIAYEARASRLTVVVPEVVVREAVGNYRRSVTGAVEGLVKTSSSLTKLRLDPPRLALDVEGAVAKYEKHLRAELTAVKAVVTEPPEDLGLLDLVDRAIERHPPFNESGSGFRDAIVWAHVMENVIGPLVPVVLVSSDKAFREDRSGAELATGLYLDLEARGLPRASVDLVTSLDGLVRHMGHDDPKLAAQVSQVFDDKDQAIRDAIREAVLATDADNLEVPGVQVDIDEAYTPSYVTMNGVSVLEGDTPRLAFIEFEAELDLKLEVSVPHEGKHRTVTRTVLAEGSATFDASSRAVENFTVWGLRADPADEIRYTGWDLWWDQH